LVASKSDEEMGGAHVFIRSKLDDGTVVWLEEAKLVFNDLVNGEQIGVSSLAIEGDVIAVGVKIFGSGNIGRTVTEVFTSLLAPKHPHGRKLPKLPW